MMTDQLTRKQIVGALHDEGLCNHEIADRTGLNVTQVALVLRALGLRSHRKLPNGRREYAERRRECARLHARGLTTAEIAREMGICPSNAWRLQRRMGLAPNRKGRR